MTAGTPKMSGLKIGVCGCGKFAACFIPRFKAHPLVARWPLRTWGRFGIDRVLLNPDAM
jgi:hypothetical protein